VQARRPRPKALPASRLKHGEFSIDFLPHRSICTSRQETADEAVKDFVVRDSEIVAQQVD
jgi:hypothetical protein